MLINQITEKDTKNLERKFEIFDKYLAEDKPAFGFLKSDPTLFAYYFFKNDRFERFKALPWQDKYLNSKSKRRLLCCARQIGKSTVTGILALHKAYFNPGFTILVISRTKDQAMELVYRMRKFLNTSRFTTWKSLPSKKQENKREITIQSEQKGVESRIIVVPATDAALGYSANVVIGDEAARWESGDKVFTEVIEPTVTWTQGDIYLLSTPAGRQGFFWKCFQMQDIWEVYQFDYHSNPHITEEEWETKKRLHSPMSWAMNYEAKFVLSMDSYFTPMEIDNSINSEAGLGWRGESPIVVGVDFGKIHDNCVIDIGCILNPTKPKNDHIIRLLDRRVKPLGTDYAIVLEELKSINNTMKPSTFVLDVTSGETPSDILSAAGVPVTPFKFTLQSKINIMSNLKILMQQFRLQIPDEPAMREQMEMFQYKISEINQDRIRVHAAEGFHDDEVDALALMAYGLTEGFGYLDSEFISNVGVVKSDDKSVERGVKANQDFQSWIEKNRAGYL